MIRQEGAVENHIRYPKRDYYHWESLAGGQGRGRFEGTVVILCHIESTSAPPVNKPRPHTNFNISPWQQNSIGLHLRSMMRMPV